MSKLYLIIGISGSGKTTKAKEIIETYKADGKEIKHFEADMFFEKDGEYIFNPEQLPAAHRWCRQQCMDAMKSGVDVIISNTSLTPLERRDYLFFAHKYNYEVEVITMTGNYENIHDVPKFRIDIQKNRFIPYSDEEFKSIK